MPDDLTASGSALTIEIRVSGAEFAGFNRRPAITGVHPKIFAAGCPSKHRVNKYSPQVSNGKGE